MDFYQKDYLIEKKSQDYQKKKGEIMVEYMKNFISKNQDLKFTIYTHSDFSPPFSNVEIINE